jgi:hypothetical protein
MSIGTLSSTVLPSHKIPIVDIDRGCDRAGLTQDEEVGGGDG